MNRIIIIENMDYTLNPTENNYISTLLEMNNQIKTALGLRTHPIQLIGASKIKAVGIIGNISLDDVNLIILPKYKEVELDSNLRHKEWIQKLFIRILKCSQENLFSTIYFSRTQVIDDEAIFTDVIAEYYIRILSSALMKAHITTYEEQVEKITAIKGKILVQKQISHPVADSKMWCKYKKMSKNNIFNQLLGWACRYLYSATSSVTIKKRLRNISKEFPVSEELLTRKSVRDIKLPRNFAVYNDSIQLAKSLYLGNANLREKLSTKGNKINGYVVNMEKAFENIVRYYINRTSLELGLMHKGQARTLLAEHEYNTGLNYHVIPDDLILYKGQKLILDAKYKLISNSKGNQKKPHRDDIYQMISSCLAYNTWEAILIYPEYGQALKHDWNIIQAVNGKPIKITACSIDINISDLELIEVIKTIIKNTIFYSEVINETELSISV
ncbi:MAG: hypothetical protein GX317_12640 [Staphylococcus equorum]|nr:hypothetical protein [Staphylococcus equorum]